MNFTSGYYFFEGRENHSACGYVLLRYTKNIVKAQCVAENIPVSFGRGALIRFVDPLNMEKPFTLGRIYLSGNQDLLRGEQHFTVNGRAFLPSSGKYDFIELVSEKTGEQILRTASSPQKSREQEPPKAPFDPFHTTNPAYSWSRAVRIQQLRQELAHNQITPTLEVVEEMKTGMEQYSHILLGSYQPGNSSKGYFLLGIPCRQPGHDPDKVYRWINKCVELPEYPEFDGYKLYYYDRETGAAVKAVLRTQG